MTTSDTVTIRETGDVMLLPELVAHLRENRSDLRQEWAGRITDAHLLSAMTNQEIFSDIADQYRAINEKTFKLLAVFMPGVKLVGNITTGVVLLYGGYRVLHGEMTIGTLAAFLLYLRMFFEPMQEISQFFNTFQSASSALEKLAGVLAEQPVDPLLIANRAQRDRAETLGFAAGEQTRPVNPRENADLAIVTSDNPRTEDPGQIIADVEAGMGTAPRLAIVDRREAIASALGAAREGDTILLAGKGHENYQVVGTEKIAFDEREIVLAAGAA